jgi:serine/threonine protein kinase
MEFIKENLFDYIKTNDNLSIEIIFHFLKEISNCLLILNKFGIIHREINLTNFLLKKNNEFNVKIIDFSFSKIIGKNELLNDFNIIISPEVLLKQPYDYKEDIWQFGLLGYYLLKRKYPFEIKNFNNLLNMDLSLNLNYYHKLKEIVIVNIINACLYKNINKRIEIIDINNLLI